MPQMSPLMWFSLFFYFILMLLMFMIIIYYFYFPIFLNVKKDINLKYSIYIYKW